MRYIIYTCTFLILICASCKEANQAKYIEHVSNRDNGLTTSIVQNGLKVTAHYLPVEYQLLQQISRGLTEDEVEVILPEMKGHHYFRLSLDSDIGLDRLAEKNGNTWNETFLQLQYHSKTKFKIKKGETEYPCVLYHTISGINPKHKQDIMLVFVNDDDSTSMENLVLTFEDDLITDTTIELIIQKDALNSIPPIELL